MMIYKELIDGKLSACEAILQGAERGAMGLTLDAAKTSEWHEAKRQYNYWFKELQKYNKQFLKTHKRTGYENINGRRVAIYEPR